MPPKAVASEPVQVPAAAVVEGPVADAVTAAAAEGPVTDGVAEGPVADAAAVGIQKSLCSQ